MSWWSALDNGSTRGRTGGVGGSSTPMEAIAIDSLRNSAPCVEHGACHPVSLTDPDRSKYVYLSMVLSSSGDSQVTCNLGKLKKIDLSGPKTQMVQI